MGEVSRLWVPMLVAAALVAVGVAVPCAAELDEVEATLRRVAEPALRWEGLGAAAWIDGPKPARDHWTGCDLIVLRPDHPVTLRAPPGAVLRLVTPRECVPPDALAVSVSNGSGLYARLPLVPAPDGPALLAFPHEGESYLVRVETTHAAGARVAVLAGRYDPPPDLAPYRVEERFPGAPAVVRRGDRAAAEEYWPASPTAGLALDVAGPARFAVWSRFRYPAGESRLAQSYRVRVGLDATCRHSLEYETTLEPRFAVLIDGQDELVSRAEVAYLEVPAGRHRLTFEPTGPVYLRLLRQRSPDYLAPRHNEPTPSAEQVRSRLGPFVQALNPWDITSADAKRVAVAPTSPAETERLALRLVRDNRQREGGLAGAMLLAAAAARRPDYPPVADAADDLRAFHTFYRDLFPIEKPTPEPARRAYFVEGRLTRPGERPFSPAVPGPLREDALDRLGEGAFFAVPDDAARALTFPIPERFGPSELRVVAAAPGGPFLVQLDDAPPVLFSPGPAIPYAEAVPSRSASALDLVGGSTLDVPFAAPTRPPRPGLAAGTVRLPLPERVNQVRVWAASSEGACVAVQYRAGKPYRLSETAFLDQYRRGVGAGPAPWAAFVAFQKGEPVVGPEADAVRELANHWTPLLRWMATRDAAYRAPVVPSTAPIPAATPAGEKAASEAIDRARLAERTGDGPAAVEAWSAALRTATGDARRVALVGRAAALFAVGEAFLAERQLRGIFLHDPDPAVRAEARARLERHYRDAADDEASQALLATATLHDPSATNFRALAAALLDGGEFELALLAALVPAEKDQPAETILRAALQVRWWQLYDTWAGRLENDRDFWRGVGLLARGDARAASPHLHQGGEHGKRLLARLTAAGEVRRALACPDLADRLRAVSDWERWQAGQTAPFHWRPDPSLAVDFAGAANVYRVDADSFADYFLATPDRPLRLRAAGPGRLRFEVRPLHPAGSTTPRDDWLRIGRPGRLRVVPMTNNLPAAGLTIPGMPNQAVGTKVEPWPVVELAPGLHALDLAAEGGPVLVRVYSQRPEFDVGGLPPITPETVPALLRADADVWDALGQDRPALPDDVDALVAKGDLRAAVALPVGDGPEAAHRRMALLVRLAETDPTAKALAQAAGEALFAAHPAVPGLATLHARLTRNTAWEPVATVRESAGVRVLDAAGFAPEGPALRTRLALARPVAQAEQVVTGTERLVLSLGNKEAMTLRLGLEVEDVPHLPPVPMVARYQVNDGPAERVDLTPGQHFSRDVPLTAGSQSLRVWIDGPPVANRFLRARFAELPGSKPVVQAARRTHQVATRSQPLRVSVDGPAWLRADEARPDGSVRSHYRLVPEGQQAVEFAPEAGEEQALFRVFRKVAVPEVPAAPPRVVEVPPRPVPPAAWLLPPRVGTGDWGRPIPPADVGPTADDARVFVDAFSPVVPSDGTWSVEGSYWRRRALLEDLLTVAPDSTQQGRADEFGEVRATYRRFDEWGNAYRETAVLTRARQGGNPTFGVEHRVRFDPDGVPVAFHLDGEGYVQTGDDYAGVPVGKPLWAAFVRARVTTRIDRSPELYHEPGVWIFGRLLSTGEDSLLQGRADLDVFTRYKAQHRAGWEIADTLHYRPWLDTHLRGRASLGFNENFYSPDYARLVLDGARLFGPVEVNVGYATTRFFADADRDVGITRHAVFTGLTWDGWTRGGDRVRFKVDYEYEFTRNVWSAFAGVAWYFGPNRYRDFGPDAIDFRGLRERRAAEATGRWME